MAEIYLGRWQWVDDPILGEHWRSPGGNAVGNFDLRSTLQCGVAGPVPQGFAMFIYATPQSHPQLLLDLGNDLTRNLTGLEKSTIRSLFGVQSSTALEDKLGRAIRQWCLDPQYVDPTGDARHKPLRGRLGRRISCKIGGLGVLFNERFNSSHPAFANTIATFKADYLRNREIALMDPVSLRKWTGHTMLKLFGKLSDLDAGELLPSKYRNDGYERPTSTVTDSFTDSDSTSLDAHTGESGTWAEVVGDWQILSNEADSDGTFKGSARLEVDLSSDDHDAQITIAAYDATNGQGGVCCRFNTDASPNQDYYKVFSLADDTMQIIRVNDGTFNFLDSPGAAVENAPDDYKIEADGSDLRSWFNGSLVHDFTDGSPLTGHLRVGITARRDGDHLDNLTASDLAAGGGRIMSSLARHGGLAGAGGIAGHGGGLAG